MKIGIITDNIREKSTGIGNYSKNCINNLLRVDKKNEYFFIDYEKNMFNKSKLCLIKNAFLRTPFKTYTWYSILPLQVKRCNFDYIFNISGVPHLGRFSEKEILWIYDLSVLLFPQFHRWWRVIIYKFLLGRNLYNSQMIITISENTKNDLIKYYKVPEEKILIIEPQIYNSVNKEIKPRLMPDGPYLLYVGTLEPRKNLSTLIRAFKKVKDQLKIDHKLIIAGKQGWDIRNIRETIYKFNLKNDVILLGYISNAEKKYLYKRASLFVYPSFYEGFGIPTIEAMLYGCPVITSETSCLPEVVGEAGLLIDPYDIKTLISAIKKVLSNKRFRDDMIEKGFKQALKYIGSDSAEKIIKLLY